MWCVQKARDSSAFSVQSKDLGTVEGIVSCSQGPYGLTGEENYRNDS